MLQVARQAPRQLGESRDLVTAFLRAFEAGDIRAAAESVGGRFQEDETPVPVRAATP